MSRHLDEALSRDFPWTFRDRHGDMRQTLIWFAYECGDGCEPLIRRIAAAMEAHAQNVPLDEWPAVLQVKEKFGDLSCYATGVSKDVMDVIVAAEGEALRTCEVCDAPGSNAEINGCWMTRCEVHWHAEQATRASLLRSAI